MVRAVTSQQLHVNWKFETGIDMKSLKSVEK